MLRELVSLVQSRTRASDVLFRWGGEEFAVLLTPPVIVEDVATVSERLRSTIERTAIRLEGLDGRAHRVNVTISIGVALFPDDADSPRDLWRAANTALLKAKRPPKNQIVFYGAQDERSFGTK